MNNKRGISTIVATVLIVLITVAAVTILWAALSPLIDRNLSSGTECFNVQTAVQIDPDKTYTCYNADGSISVRVKRAANSDTLQGFELKLSDAGNTLATNGLIEDDLSVLSENGARVFSYSAAETGVSSFTGPVILAIAPRILIDGDASSCTTATEIELKAC